VPPRKLPPYGWPVKPFDRMHPVRGYFNDPRISDSGKSRAFHFGIDVSAPDGTPVYAVEAGTVHLEGGRSISVVSEGGARAFGYWHILPAVKHHQLVKQHQLVGRIEAPWLHVHFAESRGGEYLNPLRPGGIEPWADATSPRISGIHFFSGKKELSPLQVSGPVDVVVDAYDLPPLKVPPPWNDMPVTPALLQWRVLSKAGKVVRPWHVPVDFRNTMLPADLFSAIYAPGTRQNKPPKPGLYRFFVPHTWSTKALPNGLYRLEVMAADMSGNRAHAGLPFTIHN
jgi:hypothetical protein